MYDATNSCNIITPSIILLDQSPVKLPPENPHKLLFYHIFFPQDCFLFDLGFVHRKLCMNYIRPGGNVQHTIKGFHLHTFPKITSFRTRVPTTRAIRLQPVPKYTLNSFSISQNVGFPSSTEIITDEVFL